MNPQTHDNLRPVRRSFCESPEDLARRLRHLEGFVWLDTSGHCQEGDGGISILTALPRRILSGSIFQPEGLQEALQQMNAAAVDWGFPLGGLFGAVDFDGSYVFGDYPQALIYRHATGDWFEIGALSEKINWGELPALSSDDIDFHPLLARQQFEAMVHRAQEYIAAGDIYQVNLSHPWMADWPVGRDSFELYLRLRASSPAPFAAFMDLAGRRILSSSPESFLKMSGSGIRTKPIKGTRPRFDDSAADHKMSLELRSSEKERAELLMITDLMRSDLGQVSAFGSVTVAELLKLESFAQVFHLVSAIQGVLRPDVDHVRALAACFPGGSISGAPKKRALEIIQELEPFPRGLYTGAIGFFGRNGESHFSIAIRTIIEEKGRAIFHAGAGIVADSDAAMEWEETNHKAAGMLKAARKVAR